MKYLCILAFIITSTTFGGVDSSHFIQIPDDIVLVTDNQRVFIDRVKTLEKGFTEESVIKLLGKPTSRKPSSLYYILREDRIEGGHFISASFEFHKKLLDKVSVNFGHMTLELKTTANQGVHANSGKLTLSSVNDSPHIPSTFC